MLPSSLIPVRRETKIEEWTTEVPARSKKDCCVILKWAFPFLTSVGLLITGAISERDSLPYIICLASGGGILFFTTIIALILFRCNNRVSTNVTVESETIQIVPHPIIATPPPILIVEGVRKQITERLEHPRHLSLYRRPRCPKKLPEHDLVLVLNMTNLKAFNAVYQDDPGLYKNLTSPSKTFENRILDPTMSTLYILAEDISSLEHGHELRDRILEMLLTKIIGIKSIFPILPLCNQLKIELIISDSVDDTIYSLAPQITLALAENKIAARVVGRRGKVQTYPYAKLPFRGEDEKVYMYYISEKEGYPFLFRRSVNRYFYTEDSYFVSEEEIVEESIHSSFASSASPTASFATTSSSFTSTDSFKSSLTIEIVD